MDILSFESLHRSCYAEKHFSQKSVVFHLGPTCFPVVLLAVQAKKAAFFYVKG